MIIVIIVIMMIMASRIVPATVLRALPESAFFPEPSASARRRAVHLREPETCLLLCFACRIVVCLSC